MLSNSDIIKFATAHVLSSGMLPPDAETVAAKYIPQDVRDRLDALSWWLNSDKPYRPTAKNAVVSHLRPC